MIYTVTLNPSIDYIVEVDHFQLDHLNRIDRESKFPGGKGINVSRVLNTIDVPSKALGFVGGFTGGFIQDTLENEGVQTDFVKVQDDSRINIKLKTGEETELNGQGPALTAENIEELNNKLEALQEGDILVLAGSIPPSLPNTFYSELTQKFSARGVKVVVDAGGKILAEVLQDKPFLVKPNHHELSELFGTKITTVEEVIPYGKKVVEMGAQNVIVSMAGDGALLFTNGEVYTATIPKGKVLNSVGAGDSLVAGFIGTYSKEQDFVKAFQTAVATGSATAFSQDLATKEKIDSLMDQVVITKL
ncbi:1-phosphofructokinase [Bacillus sp. AGMB 02131]|uniref:Tagatose-6-phosphate kinase n=1 Tax=Peribacillus faecalis TaxID=2772559 RepID=A0A927CXD5_9BACI|nr:1-phosphofructokinase [Peribacillus faecalis]MBD3108889.1 1-phosphofructokinase [Peribacillus faecalis]